MLLPHSLKRWLATPRPEVHCISVVKELSPNASGAPEGAPLVRTDPCLNATHPESPQQENSATHGYESNQPTVHKGNHAVSVRLPCPHPPGNAAARRILLRTNAPAHHAHHRLRHHRPLRRHHEGRHRPHRPRSSSHRHHPRHHPL